MIMRARVGVLPISFSIKDEAITKSMKASISRLLLLRHWRGFILCLFDDLWDCLLVVIADISICV